MYIYIYAYVYMHPCFQGRPAEEVLDDAFFGLTKQEVRLQETLAPSLQLLGFEVGFRVQGFGFFRTLHKFVS